MAKAKTKKTSRRSPKSKRRGAASTPKTIPVLPLAGVGLAFVTPAMTPEVNSAQGFAKIQAYFRGLSVNAFAYDPQTNTFITSGLARFYVPVIIGTGAHKVMNWLGVNRVLARHKLPISL